MPRGGARQKRPVGYKFQDKDGYWICKVAPGKWVRLHRWNLEQALGRKLTRQEHAHHRCEDPSCTEAIHLEPLDGGEHVRLHMTGYSPSDETRRKIGDVSKKFWADPEWKKGGLERLQQAVHDPVFLEGARQRMLDRWGDPAYREEQETRAKKDAPRRSRESRERWKDPEYHARQRAALKASWTPERKAAWYAARWGSRKTTQADGTITSHHQGTITPPPEGK